MSVSRCVKCDTPLPPDGHGNLCKECAEKIKTLAETEVFSSYSPQVPPNIGLIQQAFPQLEIISQLGHGGMGDVFKARQVHLDRYVALKILSTDLAERPAFAKRFAREGKILAKLNHPNIVAVFDFGQATVELPDGKSPTWFYLILEFVDGVNLRQAMREKSITPSQAVAIIPQICSALQYAHNEGVLHRDIKPENILLDAKGQIKIADFGIGKLVQEPTERSHESDDASTSILTQVGTVLGTPKYMAPEQLETPDQVDHRADIYSLGLVFYELLTGSLPGLTPPEGKTESPLEAPIDTIVYKAIKRNRSERYQSADELRTVVEDVLHSRSPSQGTSALVPKATNTIFVAVICVLVLTMLAFVGGGIAYWLLSVDRDEIATTVATPPPVDPAVTSDESVIELPPSNPLLVKNISKYDADKAEELLETLARMSGVSRKEELVGCHYWTICCSLNKQGTLLATGTGMYDKNARIFDLETKLPILKDMPHVGDQWSWIEDIAFHPVLPYLFTTTKYGEGVHVWSTETCDALPDYAIPDESKARRIAVSGDGKYLIAGTWGGRIFALNGETGEIIREYRTRHSTEVRAIAFHPDDKMFATISLDRSICFWDVDQEECLRYIPYSVAGKPTCLYFSPTGSRIAVASNNEKDALVYDVESGELLANYGGYGETIWTVDFSPDDRFVITGDNKRRAIIWDAITKKPVWTDDRSGGDGANDVYRVILTPAQDRLIVASGYNPSIYEMPPEIRVESSQGKEPEEAQPAKSPE